MTLYIDSGHKIFCCYCGKLIIYPLKQTTEHLVPLSKGGNNTPENKRPCCNYCNGWRGNKSLDFWKSEIIELVNSEKTKVPYHLVDLRIMIENIDYLIHYIDTAGLKLQFRKTIS